MTSEGPIFPALHLVPRRNDAPDFYAIYSMHMSCKCRSSREETYMDIWYKVTVHEECYTTTRHPRFSLTPSLFSPSACSVPDAQRQAGRPSPPPAIPAMLRLPIPTFSRPMEGR